MNSSSKPDILVILTSQWRASAFGYAGDPNARTPCLDALASRSLDLRQAVTPHPFGVFARAAFLTGRRCPANGIRDYYDPLPANAKTLAHAFADCGYETAFFGKWQLYLRDPEEPVVGEAHARVVVPEEHRGGFAYWEGFESGFLLNDPLLHGTELPEPTRFPGYQSRVVCERALSFFRERRDRERPLFAVVSLDAPHPPYAAPADGVSPRDPGSLFLLEGTTEDAVSQNVARKELAGYYAHGEATDQAIGSLIAGVEKEGERGEPVIAFASVHGDMHGEAGHFRKGWPHESSVRIPCLIKGPGVEAGRSGLLFSLLDLGPSLLGGFVGLDAIGLACWGFHGRDLSACWGGGMKGPVRQQISMPSVPPFAKQCPYVWSAERDARTTWVRPEEGAAFEIFHGEEWVFGESGQ